MGVSSFLTGIIKILFQFFHFPLHPPPFVMHSSCGCYENNGKERKSSICSSPFFFQDNRPIKLLSRQQLRWSSLYMQVVPLNFTKILITWNHEMPGAWFHVKITWFHVIFIPWSREIPKIRPFHVKSRDHEITWRGTNPPPPSLYQV